MNRNLMMNLVWCTLIYIASILFVHAIFLSETIIGYIISFLPSALFLVIQELSNEKSGNNIDNANRKKVLTNLINRRSVMVLIILSTFGSIIYMMLFTQLFDDGYDWFFTKDIFAKSRQSFVKQQIFVGGLLCLFGWLPIAILSFYIIGTRSVEISYNLCLQGVFLGLAIPVGTQGLLGYFVRPLSSNRQVIDYIYAVF